MFHHLKRRENLHSTMLSSFTWPTANYAFVGSSFAHGVDDSVDLDVDNSAGFRGQVLESVVSQAEKLVTKIHGLSNSARNNGGSKSSDGQDGGWKNRQLWIDSDTENHLRVLMDELEVASISELFRRALRAREDFHPDEEACRIHPVSQRGRDNSRRVTVTLSPRSEERVKRLQQDTGKDFRSLVYEAILVLSELHKRGEEEESIRLY
ncbi:hypothetical protein RHODOSMS8_00957 [Rhodobiaceae bacterium]|nr:hypothetical protein RHODOSMS8_00957 [Rhodobiaceae bacterium]